MWSMFRRSKSSTAHAASAVSPSNPDTDGPWTIATAAPDAPPLIARVNQGAAARRGHPDYRTQVGIAVPFHAPDARGFPTPAEDAQVRAIEAALRAALLPGDLAVLAAVLTTEGMREFVWYTRDPDAVPAMVKAVATTVRTHQLQLMMQEDAEWEVYAVFADGS